MSVDETLMCSFQVSELVSTVSYLQLKTVKYLNSVIVLCHEYCVKLLQ